MTGSVHEVVSANKDAMASSEGNGNPASEGAIDEGTLSWFDRPHGEDREEPHTLHTLGTLMVKFEVYLYKTVQRAPPRNRLV